MFYTSINIILLSSNEYVFKSSLGLHLLTDIYVILMAKTYTFKNNKNHEITGMVHKTQHKFLSILNDPMINVNIMLWRNISILSF